MTRRLTRASSRKNDILTTNSNCDSTGKIRSRKTKIIDDSSEDEYLEFSGNFPRTPKKNNKILDDAVTPPKQKKTDIAESPKLNNVSHKCHTPSYLLDQLSLTSPVRYKSTGNRKSLFQESNENDSINKTNLINEKTAKVKKHIESHNHGLDDDDIGILSSEKCSSDFENITQNNFYRNARKALHSSLPTSLPGREVELQELRIFIKSHIEKTTSGSMYVSGPPGTGKTASLNIILDEKEISDNIRQVYVNCTAIKSPTAIYSRIVKELCIKVSGRTEKDYLYGIENFLRKSKKMILMVLDEIDQLECKNQSILYTVFEWPSKPNFKLILIGIANALDLTDRTLPRLQAKCELKPKLMHFAPYTKKQIVDIFTSRLTEAGALEVFSAPALQMLAGKVAAVSGDVRRALDIGRRVVELIDDKEAAALKSVENITNACFVEKESKETKKVDLKEVLNVLNNVYGTTQNLTEDTDDTFPLQQKIIICSLILILKKAKNKEVTVGKLHEVYKRVCSKRNILAVDQSEFIGLCMLIETRGIIRISGKKEPRLNKVHLEWDEEEVSATLKDKQMMSMILQDESCLGRF